MGRRRLEEILEECLSAYLEGRRSVEESLSLYPSLARELEPLLRTAIEVAEGLESPRPPRHIAEESRQRFLAAAAARRRARAGAAAPRAGAWGRWALVAVAAAVAVAALTVGSATVLRDRDSGLRAVRVQVVLPSPSAATYLRPQLEQARVQLAALQSLVEQGAPLDQDIIAELKATSSQIVLQLEDPQSLDEQAVEEVVMLATQQYRLLTLARGQLSGSGAATLQETLELAEDMLKKLGATPVAATPTPTPTPSPTPAPSATPEQTATTTVTPTP